MITKFAHTARYVALGAVVAAGLGLAANGAQAQSSVQMVDPSQGLSSDQLNNLIPDPNAPKTRQIMMRPQGGQAQAAAAAPPPAIGLQINFAVNSYDIPANFRSVLDQIGQRMSSTPGAKLVVEGHTDASGDAGYNMVLSQRRAEAVKSYLMQNHRIPATNISVVGKGETELLDASNPNAGVNRRVQFRAGT